MREVELQDVAEIIAGQSPKSEFYNESGEGVPFFQGKTDFGDNYPTVTTWCTKPKKMAKEGVLLEHQLGQQTLPKLIVVLVVVYLRLDLEIKLTGVI